MGGHLYNFLVFHGLDDELNHHEKSFTSSVIIRSCSPNMLQA